MSRRKTTTINDEVRRLQKVIAVLIACHVAMEEGADFDAGDVLAVVIALLRESLDGLDGLEVTNAQS